MFGFIRHIRQVFIVERNRKEKLKNLFQEGKNIRNIASGKIFTVIAVESSSKLGAQACLQGPSGKLTFVSWSGAGGIFHSEVADAWEDTCSEIADMRS